MKCQAEPLGSKTSIMKTNTFKLRMTQYHCLTGYGLCKTSEHKHSKVLFFPPKPKANCTKSRVWDRNKTNDGLDSNV